MTAVVTLETPSLGDRSYVLASGDLAVVVDPQRDVDRILSVLSEQRLHLTHVLETHVHNDYVSGGLELSRITGAAYVLPEGSGAAFSHVVAHDGDVLGAGGLRLTAIRTPGHTYHHTSYLVVDDDGDGVVLTGGSLLFGTVGRTDLVASQDTDALTHLQFRSVRRLAGLPGEAAVLPTHGFGSFCSAAPASGAASTVAEQRRVNPALTQDEEAFVRTLLEGLDAYPAYYARMAPLNRAGPEPLDLRAPRVVDADELRWRVAEGEWVVDLRDRRSFADAHLPGTLSFGLGGSFATYLGWLHPWGSPLTLVAPTTEDVAVARRELARIGVDRIAGTAVGPVEQLAEAGRLRSFRRTDFAGLRERLDVGEPVWVLDVRRHDERSDEHLVGSIHVPVHELPGRLDDVPPGEVWVHCEIGYRASVAASLLARAGREVVLVDDRFRNARMVGLDVAAG